MATLTQNGRLPVRISGMAPWDFFVGLLMTNMSTPFHVTQRSFFVFSGLICFPVTSSGVGSAATRMTTRSPNKRRRPYRTFSRHFWDPAPPPSNTGRYYLCLFPTDPIPSSITVTYGVQMRHYSILFPGVYTRRKNVPHLRTEGKLYIQLILTLTRVRKKEFATLCDSWIWPCV